MIYNYFFYRFCVSAVVCMYFLFVLCMLVYTGLPGDQPQAEGTFPVQIKIHLYLSNSRLSVIQKNFYKFDRPETAGLFFPPTEVVSHGNNTK